MSSNYAPTAVEQLATEAMKAGYVPLDASPILGGLEESSPLLKTAQGRAQLIADHKDANPAKFIQLGPRSNVHREIARARDRAKSSDKADAKLTAHFAAMNARKAARGAA